jgi:hypothetical protein
MLLLQAVKAAAAELMQSDEPSLDKIWLAQLFPSAAPGNLASSGVGSWPLRLHGTKAGPTSPPAAAAAAAAGTGTAAAAAAAAGRPASASGAGAEGAGVSRQTSIDLADYDVIELLGEWSEEGSEGQPPDEGQAGSDSDVIIVGSSSEDGEPEQQLEQEEEDETEVLLPSGTQRQQGSQAWPWLRKPASQQQQQVESAQPDAVLQQQLEVKKAVSRLLHSSKQLYPSPQQQRQVQQQIAAAAATQQLPPSLSAGRGAEKSAAAAAGDAPAGKGSDHLLRFTRASKTTTAAAVAAEGQQQPAAPAPRASKRVQRPADASSAAGLHGREQQQQQQQQQGVGSREGSADADVDSLRPEEWRDVKGVHAPELYPVHRYNRPPVRPRKQAVPAAGLSKGEQARMELLGRGPAADSDAEEAALAAELIAAAGVSHGRRGASSAVRQHQQQGQGRDRNNSRLGSGRHDGVSSAGRAALHRAAAALVQQQRQAQEPELLLQRMRQRRQEEQQQALIRRQQQQAREERRKQLEAARAAEAAAAASAKQQDKQQPAAGRGAGIALVSDDALFKQAAAAAAANRPRPAAAVRTITTVRHQGPLFLRSSRGPPTMGFGAPRAPARQYPVLRIKDVWAELLSWGYQGAVGSSGQGGSSAAAAAAAATRKLLEEGRVPLRFTCVGHYCAVFRGLLLEELRAGLAAAHEEHVSGSTSSSSSSAGNARGGGFSSLPLVVDSVQRQSKVSVVTAHVDTSGLQPREKDSPRSEDFVLLTRVQLGSGSELAEDRLPRSHLSGLVVEASNLQQGLRQITLHVAPAAGGSQAMAAYWSDQLKPGNPLWVTVISSLVPNFREFQVSTRATACLGDL